MSLLPLLSQPFRRLITDSVPSFLPSFFQAQCRDKMKEQLLCRKMGNWNPAVTPQNRHSDTENVFFYPIAQGRTSSIKNTFDTKPDCPR